MTRLAALERDGTQAATTGHKHSDFIVVSVPGLHRAVPLVAARAACHHQRRAMFVGLIDTRDRRPDPVGREPLWLDLPELRPWRWYVATIVCMVLAVRLGGWPGLIPLMIGFGCFLHAIGSYYKGNDGLSKYRQ